MRGCQIFWGTHGCGLFEDHLGEHLCLDPTYQGDGLPFYTICSKPSDYTGTLAELFWFDDDVTRPRMLLKCADNMYFEFADSGCVGWAGDRVSALERLVERDGLKEGKRSMRTLDQYGILFPQMADCIRRFLRATAERNT